MKKYVLAAVGVVAVATYYHLSFKPETQENGFLQHDPQSTLEEFTQYLSQYGKSYPTKEEFDLRLKQFTKSKATIMISNSQNGKTYRSGLNQFSDWTEEEYLSILGNKNPKGFAATDSSHLYIFNNTENLPESVDWRDKGVLNPIKNQKKCGSCWSFSSAAAVESHHAIESNTLYSLSEQQMVDCSRSYGNEGCNGGFHDQAFQYVRDYGLETEDDYPYFAEDRDCVYDKTKVKVYVKNYYNVQTKSPSQLKAAVAQGPVSVSVDASGAFRNYQGGILGTDCGTSLNHAVLVVGYGVEGDLEYYIVRNSWGTSWGEQGYVRISITDGIGTCGIQTRPSWPTTYSA